MEDQLTQERPEGVDESVSVSRLSFAFPNRQNTPPRPAQRRLAANVALDVARDLRPPVGRICFRVHVAAAAVVPVPKASVHEDNLLPGGEDEIGLAGEILPVEPVAISHAVDETAHHELRLSVFRPDRPHVRAA